MKTWTSYFVYVFQASPNAHIAAVGAFQQPLAFRVGHSPDWQQQGHQCHTP